VIGSLSAATMGTKLIVLGTIAAFLLGAGFAGGLKWSKGQVDDLKLQHSEVLRGIANQAAKVADLSRQASEKFRQRESEQAQRFVDIAANSYQKGKTDAQASADAVADDLRAGNRKLRHQWLGCVSASRGAAETSASAGGTDDAADLRAAGVGRVLGIVGACQAHVTSLQAILTAERTP
jgi:hypothetical protein